MNKFIGNIINSYKYIYFFVFPEKTLNPSI